MWRPPELRSDSVVLTLLVLPRTCGGTSGLAGWLELTQTTSTAPVRALRGSLRVDAPARVGLRVAAAERLLRGFRLCALSRSDLVGVLGWSRRRPVAARLSAFPCRPVQSSGPRPRHHKRALRVAVVAPQHPRRAHPPSAYSSRVATARSDDPKAELRAACRRPPLVIDLNDAVILSRHNGSLQPNAKTQTIRSCNDNQGDVAAASPRSRQLGHAL